MNYPTPLPAETAGDDPVGEIYKVLAELNAKDRWSLATTIMGGVLKSQDEFTQARMLAGLSAELRAAVHAISEIQAGRPNPVSLQ
jgi:hypothetical protein